MKRWNDLGFRFAALTVGAAVLAGCGGDGGSASTGGGGSSAGNRFLSLGTAPTGGAFYVVGGALVEVLNDVRPEGVGKFSAVATKGSQQNIRDIDKHILDFGLSNAAITYFSVRGEGDWEKPYAMRAVMTLAPNVAMFLTPKSSGIRSIGDLKGKRVVVGPAGAGFEYFLKPLLEAHGVKFEDFTPVYATQDSAVDYLADGNAEAAFLGGAVPTSSIVQACSTLDVYFIPYSQQAMKSLVDEYLFFAPAKIPGGAYADLKEDFTGLNVGSMHLITSSQQDEQLVYQVTKALYEHREDVVQKHPAGKFIRPDVVARSTGTEFHPGAIRYYKEIGIWPDDASQQDPNQLNTSGAAGVGATSPANAASKTNEPASEGKQESL